MAETLKVLGQANPLGGVLTDAYICPSETSATISTLIVANRTGTQTSFRVSIAVAGAADDPKQYIYYDVMIVGNDTFAATIGITLGATDVLRVFANDPYLSFGIFGVEVS